MSQIGTPEPRVATQTAEERREAERRCAEVDLTLSIADAVRYLDRPLRDMTKVGLPIGAGVGGVTRRLSMRLKVI